MAIGHQPTTLRSYIMSPRWKWFAAGALLLAVTLGAGALMRSDAQEKEKTKTETGKDDSAALAAVRKTADGFTETFNKGDAKGMAAFWTKEGEYIDDAGTEVRGRDAIEKQYAEFFKASPKATIEISIHSVRLLSRTTAVEEGTVKVTVPGRDEQDVSRYSVLHVKEEDGWKMASVREWEPDPSELVSLKDLEWIVGTWTCKEKEVEAKMTYAWDANKAFLKCDFRVAKGDATVTSGTQVIGKDPFGGLRSWQFDQSGGFGEWAWAKDGNRWVIESSTTLPDGREATSVYLLIPIDKDSFTWQSVDNAIDGVELADNPPVKLTRVTK
jgi:uncharacterized protein (TIGR02246 family)